MQSVTVKGSIRLDQFLKWAGVSGSGGQAKIIIQSGAVKVNGEQLKSRGKVLEDGDEVSVEDFGSYRVVYGAVEKE
ncbi:MAG: RNA-binding S4 domain-containing protein [Desulfocucumaceae bacterium]